MKLEDIQAAIEQDSKINDAKLDQESLKIPELHSKYYNIFMDELRRMKLLESEYSRLKKDRVEYYLGLAQEDVYRAEPLHRKVMRQDLDLYLESDTKLADLKLRASMQRSKVELLEAFIKTLNNRNFLIKNAIDFRRFQHGS